MLEAVEEGGASELLSRYMEAWLLKLHGLYPPLDRCAGCGGALPDGDLHYDGRAHGFVCAGCGPASGPVLPAAARSRLQRVFRLSPREQTESAGAVAEAALASFHRQLITRHERDLHSYHVLGEMAREGVR